MPLKIDTTWSLFLDRDGVINERLPGDYVASQEQFRFIEGVFEALQIFAGKFGIIVVVTNQQGIGKGLMTEQQLKSIHQFMLQEVKKHDGRIDAVYHSPYLAQQKHISRKPSVGMALQARSQFRSIHFKRSVMAGDSLSDMKFGKSLGMNTVFIGPVETAVKYPLLIDFVYPDLRTFALSISELDSPKH